MGQGSFQLMSTKWNTGSSSLHKEELYFEGYRALGMSYPDRLWNLQFWPQFSLFLNSVFITEHGVIWCRVSPWPVWVSCHICLLPCSYVSAKMQYQKEKLRLLVTEELFFNKFTSPKYNIQQIHQQYPTYQSLFAFNDSRNENNKKTNKT